VSSHEAILQARSSAETLVPGGLDFVAFFLDDGTVAGQAPAVAKFVEVFTNAMSEIGLTLSAAKCEVVPAAGSMSTVDPQLFPGCQLRAERSFRLLGPAHCTRRTQKACQLLGAIRGFSERQGVLRLLRQCASWCKLVYSGRTVARQVSTSTPWRSISQN